MSYPRRTPRFILVLVALVLLVGCSSAGEPPVQSGATPETNGVPTEPPPPPGGTGTVTGAICFPATEVPEMTVYFQNNSTFEIESLPTQQGQEQYSAQLPTGRYTAYAWLPGNMSGGLYSQAVPCGLTPECTDHTPLAVDVRPGETTSGVDICDWNAQSLPLPPELAP